MEIIKQFGVEPVLLTAQIVNFLILFFLLKKFAYKPIFKMLQDRKKAIENGIKQSEEAKMSLEKALLEEKNILKKAQTNAQLILQDAKQQADELIVKAKEQAKTEMTDMMVDAKRQMKDEAEQMEKRLASSTAELAVDLVRAAVKNAFNEKEQKVVIAKVGKNMRNK